MTMMDVRPADLTELSDTDIALAYGQEGADIAALAAEEDRRAELRRRRIKGRSARHVREGDWYTFAHGQFLQAEAECAGNLVNNHGRYRLNERGYPDPVDPWSLWSGSEWAVDAYASFELQRFWERNPRITRAEWQRQEARARREENDQLDRDAPDSLRHGTSGDADESAEDRGGNRLGTGDTVSGNAARAGDRQAGDPGAAADAGGSPAVRDSSCDVSSGTCRHPHRIGTRKQCGDCPAARVILTPANPVTVIPGPIQHDPAAVAAYQRMEQRKAELAAERARTPVAPPAYSVPAPQPVSPAAVAVRPAGTVVAGRQEIDGDQVLRYLFTFLKRFALWGSDAEVVTAALWVAQAHARDGDGMPVWQYCARLGIFGPSGSGKSWKSRLIGKLAPAGEILLEPTKPSFIDMVADRNTVIITEADELFYTSGRNRGILAVVNASYEPDRTNTRKQGGKVVKVTLFGHVVLDGLDVMLQATRPDLRTMISRTICMMSAAGPEGYRPPRFDRQARGIAGMLGQRTAAWMAQEVADGMADDVPQVPEHLGNRPFALWEPLFAVAARADRAIARREGTDENEPGPWWLACAEACEVLEAGAPVIDESDDDDMSELDRAMADWAGAA